MFRAVVTVVTQRCPKRSADLFKLESLSGSSLQQMRARKPINGTTLIFNKNALKLLYSARYYASTPPPPIEQNDSLRQILTRNKSKFTEINSSNYQGQEVQVPYDSDAQIKSVFRIANAFAHAINTGDKKRDRVSVITGINGIGKTRFATELPSLLRQACAHPDAVRCGSRCFIEDDSVLANIMPQSLQTPSVAIQSPPIQLSSNGSDLGISFFEENIQLLKTALTTNCKTIYIDWSEKTWLSNNTQQYSADDERDWSSSVRIGLRVAAQYWFPNYSFESIRAVMKSSPHLRSFTLYNVLEAMYDEDTTISAVYLIFDEFQTTLDVKVPPDTPSIGNATELLTRTLARALSSAARAQGKFFVFGSLVGTHIPAENLVTSMGDEVYLPTSIQRLSYQRVQNLIRRIDFGNGVSGADWLGLKGFDTLIKLTGGLPRAIKVLVELMEHHGTLPEKIDLDLDDWYKHLYDDYTNTFNIDESFGSDEMYEYNWPLLLGVAGYNTARCTFSSDVQRSGFFTELERQPDAKWEKYYSACKSVYGFCVLDVSMPVLLVRGYSRAAAQIESPKSLGRPFTPDEELRLSALLSAPVLLPVGPLLMTYHLLLRWNVFNIKTDNKEVLAADLFVGGIFRPEFGSLKFMKEDTVITMMKNSSFESTISLTDPEVVQQCKNMDPNRRGRFFKGNKPFNSHIQLWIKDGRKKRIAIIWQHTKHIVKDSPELTPQEVAKIGKKRLELEKTLPQFIHLAVIYTNRDYNGDVPSDPYTCIIDKYGMSFSLSPLLKWLIVEE